jgi:glycerol uptake facilitator protein
MAPRGIHLPAWFLGEFLGTFILAFFGCGSVATAVLTGAPVGIFQVAIVWGIGISTAIYLTASLSGAHLNPAVTFSFVLWGDFPWRRLPGYVAAQFLGAFAASAALFALFHGILGAYEGTSHIARGAPGSEATAMIFGEFYPNPGGHPLTPALRALVTTPTAFATECLGTAILVLVIHGSIDERNSARPRALTAVTIGLTVTILISLLGPLTMAALNPARDLAPRIFSALAGWGKVPFTANGSGWFVVYVLGPLAGAAVGGGIYRVWLAPAYRRNSPQADGAC